MQIVFCIVEMPPDDFICLFITEVQLIVTLIGSHSPKMENFISGLEIIAFKDKLMERIPKPYTQQRSGYPSAVVTYYILCLAGKKGNN